MRGEAELGVDVLLCFVFQHQEIESALVTEQLLLPLGRLPPVYLGSCLVGPCPHCGCLSFFLYFSCDL
jgi:hypothetical protein